MFMYLISKHSAHMGRIRTVQFVKASHSSVRESFAKCELLLTEVSLSGYGFRPQQHWKELGRAAGHWRCSLLRREERIQEV